ncbi:MAG: iron chelate uptake ABC transporter family permease subunit [Humibacillus sp.]|nr:iron chelate uptake ABC transporter family permease subunit [Humibacillus sp.]MDN5779360.1 iron chelate uptake ABC transporter family permease subunit [Humibacillus sp.]
MPAGYSPLERARRRQTVLTIVALIVLALAALALYQFAWVTGSWSYTMNLRARQVGALVVAGVSVGVSSVVFQTIAGSRILTPGVMGFDALYVLVNTFVVFLFGSATFMTLSVAQLAVVNTAALTLFGVLLFRGLFRRHSRNLLVLVLIGIVMGALFASLSSFASRLLSPDDYLSLQSALFASFNTVDATLLAVVAVITLMGCAMLVPVLRHLDAIDLGFEGAICLGVPYHRVVSWCLLVVTALVATATALVGPITFLGLVVANLARQLLRTHRHRPLVVGSAAIGVVSTVIGQLVVARLLNQSTPLAVVVNVIGGIYFLALVMRTVRL